MTSERVLTVAGNGRALAVTPLEFASRNAEPPVDFPALPLVGNQIVCVEEVDPSDPSSSIIIWDESVKVQL